MINKPSAPYSAACCDSSMVSGKFDVPEQTMMLRPFLCLSAVSATFFRSATENEGYSPVEPRTTMPSAPFALKYAIMSLYKSSSNFRFLSQGVAAAIQKRHLVAGPACAVTVHAEVPALVPTAPRAATAPKPSRNVLRVVSIVSLPLLLPASGPQRSLSVLLLDILL